MSVDMSRGIQCDNTATVSSDGDDVCRVSVQPDIDAEARSGPSRSTGLLSPSTNPFAPLLSWRRAKGLVLGASRPDHLEGPSPAPGCMNI